MAKIVPPLYPFFRKLQAYDRQKKRKALGVDLYLQFIEVIGKGYGLQSKEELFWICKMLWQKPYHRPSEFRQLFDNYFLDLQKKEEAGTPVKPQDEDLNEENRTNIEKPEVDSPGKPDSDPEEDPGKKEENEIKSSVETQESSPVKKSVALKFQYAARQSSRYLKTDLDQIEKEVLSKAFLVKGKYTSISPRKAAQSIRSLRIEHISPGKRFIDVAATINRVAQKGFLDQVILKGGKIAGNKLCILIDYGGSMAAFDYLTELFEKAVKKQYPQNEKLLFYFRNTPVSRLFFSKSLTSSISLSKFLKQYNYAFLIFSDAGAARGFHSQKRVDATRQFLEKIRDFPAVWLNPMPKNRWEGTSADFISDYIDMYEATDEAFVQAIKQLKKSDR